MPETLSRDEWLARRRQYIGGSDAAAALGLSPYTTRLELCKDKWGEKADLPTAVMERGTVLEDVVAELYRRSTGHTTEPGAWCVSPDHPWMAATTDLADITAGAICQIKTHSQWARHRWGDATRPDVPAYELLQCQHEMVVTGARTNILVVLFADESAFRGMVHMARGGFRPASIADHVEALIADDMAELLPPIAIARDEAMIADIVEGERQFWERYVIPHVCPPDASIPQTSPDILDADSEQTEVLEALRDAKRDQNAAAERYEEQRVKVIEAIGPHSGIVAQGIAKVRYSAPPVRSWTDWQGIAEMICEWMDKPMPKIETWQSIAQQLGLEAGDELYNTAVGLCTYTEQPPRVFRPTFARGQR